MYITIINLLLTSLILSLFQFIIPIWVNFSLFQRDHGLSLLPFGWLALPPPPT